MKERKMKKMTNNDIVQDLKKARFYLDYEIKRLEGLQNGMA